MSRTYTRPHTAHHTPRRTRNLLLATARQVITDYNIYGNRIPLIDDTPYDDVIRDAAQWQDRSDV